MMFEWFSVSFLLTFQCNIAWVPKHFLSYQDHLHQLRQQDILGPNEINACADVLLVSVHTSSAFTVPSSSFTSATAFSPTSSPSPYPVISPVELNFQQKVLFCVILVISPYHQQTPHQSLSFPIPQCCSWFQVIFIHTEPHNIMYQVRAQFLSCSIHTRTCKLPSRQLKAHNSEKGPRKLKMVFI